MMRAYCNRMLTLSILGFAVFLAPWIAAQQHGKIRGYITARPDRETVMILDDVILLRSGLPFDVQDAPAGTQVKLDQLDVGMMIEAEGVWSGKNRFTPDKIKCDWDQLDKQIKEYAYLERDPASRRELGMGQPCQLNADGEVLVLDSSTKFDWGSQNALKTESEIAALVWAGRQIRYTGTRQTDGTMLVKSLEVAGFPPADAFEIDGKRKLVRAKDAKTGIDILEFRKDKKVEGRFKLCPIREVQDYVSGLGTRLIPPMLNVPPLSTLEFRFFVVEDATANAMALPDGAIIVNTGLLGLIENEAQLAFVLSHEIAHALQAHHYRHVHDTRTARVLITIGAIAASTYAGDLATFLGELGLNAVVNGYSRRIENQADRLALQSIVDNNYDASQAVKFFRLMVSRYSDRSTSAIWSNHDSSLLRGSFLTVQIARRYQQQDVSKGTVDTSAFSAMKEALGPVKIR